MKAVITFGRLNPITIGHAKLIEKVKAEAKRIGGKPFVYLSHSQDAKKNPLDYNTKVMLAKKSFGPSVIKSKSRNIIEILQELEKKRYTEITLVVGSDRVAEFQSLTSKYNGKEYKFDAINVVSAGERDPDAEGISGMSASKMRAVAQAGNYEAFKDGTPKTMSEKDKKAMYDKIRSVMGISEEKEIEIDDKDLEASDSELDRFIDSIDLDNLDEEDDDFDLDEDFQEFMEEEELSEKPLTIQQRLKRARVMRRLAPRIKRKREMLKRRMADPKRLMIRARKAAIRFLRKRVAGKQGQNYASLGPSQKIAIDRLIQKRLPMVGKIAKRLMPRIRKAEIERFKRARSAKKESVDLQFDNFFSEDKTFQNLKKKFELTDTIQEVQDPDIKDRPGSQPAGYHSGLKKSTKIARDRHFKKFADKDDRDPTNYKPAPGDARAETKPSKYTLKYKSMYGEDTDAAFEKFISEEYIEEKALEGLKKKAEKSGISYATLKKVYDRGMAAWKSGHRPGTTPQQWAYARVNSYITKGKTYHTTDSDLREADSWRSEGHYLKNGEEWSGDQHAYNGEVYTGKEHGPDSKRLYHYKELSANLRAKIDAKLEKQIKEQEAVKNVRDTIKREKEADKIKHDRMLDQARVADARKKGRETRPQIAKEETVNDIFEKMIVHDNCGTPDCCGQCDTATGNINESFTAGISDTMYAKDFEEHKVHGGFAYHPSVMEQGGAGEEGTKKLVKKYKEGTPGEMCEAIELMKTLDIDLIENIYRPLSEKYFEFFREARRMMHEGTVEFSSLDRQILQTDLGEFDFYEDMEVPLDCPMVMNEEEESTPELNKPHRGGPKKYYVYVRDPSTGNVKRVTWGDTTGLKVKINDPAARKSFAARHQCDTRNDKTTASYWACRLPRYAKSLGLQVDNPGSWW